MKSRLLKIAAVAGLAILAAGFFHARGSGVGLGSLAPELRAGPWLNSEPLKLKDLRGKVILINMWTFT